MFFSPSKWKTIDGRLTTTFLFVTVFEKV